jgi:Uma2 family endonuclease
MTPAVAAQPLPPGALALPPTVADLVADLGGIPLERIWLHPLPGQATEQDVLYAHDHLDRLCELVDGVLVEKPMGYPESKLAVELGALLRNHVRPHKLGSLAGEAGMMRLRHGLVRMPDVSFVSRQRVEAAGATTKDRIAGMTPDLAVEVLSASNTRAEMARKRREYFAGGARLVWEIDPKARTVDVFTGPDQSVTLDATQVLDGGAVLPGFRVALADLFAVLDE